MLGYALAFTPDGRVLASGGLGDRFVHLWDVEKGSLLRELEQNVGGVHSLEFSPDGRTLAVGGYGEPYAALLDVESGRSSARGSRPAETARWVDVSLTGLPVANARQRRGSCLGHRSGVLGEARARVANRTLTQEEWKKFLPEGGPTSRPARG